MRLAIIGDIHSNKEALKAVLLDMNHKQIDYKVSTGDLVGYMQYPNEVIGMIKAHNILSIQGNHDERIALADKVDVEVLKAMDEETIQKSASLAYTACVISDDNKQFLDSLPKTLSFDFEDLKLQVVHGSPLNNKTYMYEDAKQLEEYAGQSEADIVISGHTHIPYFTKSGDKYVGNAGSVGIPKHGSKDATYIILEIVSGQVTCEIVEVAYDVTSVVEAIKASPFISNRLVPVLETGQV